MASGYASKLKKGIRYGLCGSPEYFDSDRQLETKIDSLVKLINESNDKIVIFTGAGISTSVGLPDFRGPNGVWTLEKKGLLGNGLPNELSCDEAVPSLAHMSIVGLFQSGKVIHCVSQNVDGLHLRSGLPKSVLSELHGNVFVEECEDCGMKYYREDDVDSIGFKLTGNVCEESDCKGKLRDVLLDWDDALPEDQYEAAVKACKEASLTICLGTSLRVIPADRLPCLTVKNGGRMAIINLQKTPKDKKASILINGKCDQVMSILMKKLSIDIPVYTKSNSVLLVLSKKEEEKVIIISVVKNGTDKGIQYVSVCTLNSKPFKTFGESFQLELEESNSMGEIKVGLNEKCHQKEITVPFDFAKWDKKPQIITFERIRRDYNQVTFPPQLESIPPPKKKQKRKH
eukprot:TRINITY_DN7088_c0_g1_i1.p1 TRINITY_DN7088_c0_g1~~TRINITY_DN7088_c0_g1_i1.p1  ORF type:complete len:401 (-),score=142.92 TRINITY_DN7088_c0_g1_i1:2835-4037(-)